MNQNSSVENEIKFNEKCALAIAKSLAQNGNKEEVVKLLVQDGITEEKANSIINYNLQVIQYLVTLIEKGINKADIIKGLCENKMTEESANQLLVS